VDDDDVFNSLVDNCELGAKALAESKEESEMKFLVFKDDRHSIKRRSVQEVWVLSKGDRYKIPKVGLQ
jgi:hypothetical protein